MEPAIVMPNGRLDGAASPAFLAAVTDAARDGVAGLVIDFTDVSYISSAGLRVILIAAKSMAARGGRLALCSLGRQVAEVLELSDFIALPNLSIHSNQDEARRALGGPIARGA